MAPRSDGSAAREYHEPTDEQLVNFILVTLLGPGERTESERRTVAGIVANVPEAKAEWLARHRELQEAAWAM